MAGRAGNGLRDLQFTNFGLQFMTKEELIDRKRKFAIEIVKLYEFIPIVN